MLNKISNEKLDYKKQYLKYKNKYLNNKNTSKINQIGGKPNVFFSYQGAFAPPHLGHLNSARIFINELIKRYTPLEYDINFMFMPTCDKSSKKSLSFATSKDNKSEYVSEESRKKMLEIYVKELKKEFPNIIITCSDIEFNICKKNHDELTIDDLIINKSYPTATINTLSKLRNDSGKDSIIGLGIGIDNGFEISNWSNIKEYVSEPVNLEFILMCDRKLSAFNPPIDISNDLTIIEKSIRIIKIPPNLNIEAFTNTKNNNPITKMYFKSNSILEMEFFNILVCKMSIIDSPDEFSSSSVRKLIKNIYEIESLYTRNDTIRSIAVNSIWDLVVNMCGLEITQYIRCNKIFNN